MLVSLTYWQSSRPVNPCFIFCIVNLSLVIVTVHLSIHCKKKKMPQKDEDVGKDKSIGSEKVKTQLRFLHVVQD